MFTFIDDVKVNDKLHVQIKNQGRVVEVRGITEGKNIRILKVAEGNTSFTLHVLRQRFIEVAA